VTESKGFNGSIPASMYWKITSKYRAKINQYEKHSQTLDDLYCTKTT